MSGTSTTCTNPWWVAFGTFIITVGLVVLVVLLVLKKSVQKFGNQDVPSTDLAEGGSVMGSWIYEFALEIPRIVTLDYQCVITSVSRKNSPVLTSGEASLDCFAAAEITINDEKNLFGATFFLTDGKGYTYTTSDLICYTADDGKIYACSEALTKVIPDSLPLMLSYNRTTQEMTGSIDFVFGIDGLPDPVTINATLQPLTPSVVYDPVVEVDVSGQEPAIIDLS